MKITHLILLVLGLSLISCKKGKLYKLLDTKDGEVWRLVDYNYAGPNTLGPGVTELSFVYQDGKGEFLTCEVDASYDPEEMEFFELVPGSMADHKENQLTIESWFISNRGNRKRTNINLYQGVAVMYVRNGHGETKAYEMDLDFFPEGYGGHEKARLLLSTRKFFNSVDMNFELDQ